MRGFSQSFQVEPALTTLRFWAPGVGVTRVVSVGVRATLCGHLLRQQQDGGDASHTALQEPRPPSHPRGEEPPHR